MKKAFLLIIPIAILGLVYALGPRPSKPMFDSTMPTIKVNNEELDRWIADKEATYKLRPDNEAKVVWFDENFQPTEYAIVYLHGFTASHEEGYPIHISIAKSFGCNLYLSRLSMHGIDTTEKLLGLTADSYWESAKEALAIGKKIGKKIILMGTSTGGTQALQLAATYPEDIAALVLFSPNIAINNPSAFLLNDPWGLQIAKMVVGGKYISAADTTELYAKYWSTPYRVEATAQLQEMLERTMHKSTFDKIEQPLLLLYYYKDEKNQDPVVKVDKMLEMFNQVATPQDKKMARAIPEAGDHVIGSYIKSGDVKGVLDATTQFLQDILGLEKFPLIVPQQ
jgi:pimeloyl-ACP methyl ester carboxylesterase